MGRTTSGLRPAENEEEGRRAAAEPGDGREALAALMLRACGERGYREVRLAELGAGAGSYRDEAECFARGYAIEGERLRRLLGRAAHRGAGRREVIEAVLGGLASLIAERPAVARSLFAEVHVAGGRAARERARLVADLATAIDGLYREEGAPAPAPRDSAAFMVEVIETVAQCAAIAGDATILAGAIPDLARMLEDLYGEA